MLGDDDQSNGEERPFKEIGERLRLLREVIGLDPRSFADRAGLGQSTYNQYERGLRRPAIENAIALCEAYNVSLDWIYRGDLGGVAPSRGASAERSEGRSLSKATLNIVKAGLPSDGPLLLLIRPLRGQSAAL